MCLHQYDAVPGGVPPLVDKIRVRVKRRRYAGGVVAPGISERIHKYIRNAGPDLTGECGALRIREKAQIRRQREGCTFFN
jgi:hypothetical protein